MPLILLPPSRLLSISDGDTPEVKMGVRLLGIDAPELHFPLGSSPESQDPVFAKLPTLNAWQTLPQALRDYLAPRMEGAGTRQKKWGLPAKAAFEAMEEEALAIPGKKSQRELFMACGPEVLDRYGRVLAYMGPCIPKAERGVPLKAEGEGVRGNEEVPPLSGLPARGQGVTGRKASAVGGRQSPPLESAPPRDAPPPRHLQPAHAPRRLGGPLRP